MNTTLVQYFGLRFLLTLCAVVGGVIALIALIDYVETMRRYSDLPDLSALYVARTSLFRVPQLAERILPFCFLIGTMSCYLGLSRRLELVIARAAGMSAWQFTAPAVVIALFVGVLATTVYNPLAANLHERSKRLEAELSGPRELSLQSAGSGFWIRQRSVDGFSIINAGTTREQGMQLGVVTVFTLDSNGRFLQRIEARSAKLEAGYWQLEDARIYAPGSPTSEPSSYRLPTNLTFEQVRETFSTPETVPFWQLPFYIRLAENAGLAAAGYRLQYQKLLSRPFTLAAMVLLAAAFSLQMFRFGGVQKMVFIVLAAGFSLYVITKVTDDLGNAELMHPVVAAWLPAVIGGLAGFVALLYREDG